MFSRRRVEKIILIYQMLEATINYNKIYILRISVQSSRSKDWNNTDRVNIKSIFL